MSGFWSAPNELFDEHAARVPLAAVGLYCYLCRKANGEGRAWPSLATIQEALGITRNTARRHLRDLAEAGLIVIGQRADHRGAHEYRIVAHVSGGRLRETGQTLTPSEANGAIIHPLAGENFTLSGQNGSENDPLTGEELTPSGSGDGAEKGQILTANGSKITPEGYPLKDTQVPPSGVLPPYRSEERTSPGDEKTATEPEAPPKPRPTRPPKPPPELPPAKEAAAPDYTTAKARGLACQSCKAHYLAEFGRNRPGGKPPVATGADAGILKNALTALREADGGDWLEAETELKRLLTLFFADEYAARQGWPLKLLPGMLNALRGLGSTTGETHGTSRERDGRGAGRPDAPRPGDRRAHGDDRERRMDARLIALADDWPDDPHVLAAIQRQRQRDGACALA